MDMATLNDVMHQILTSSGPWAALFVIVVLWHLRYVERQAAARLADKDKEIDRIVAQRNRLEEAVLSKRKSSGGTNAAER
jgi:hypothetical protein